MASLAKTTWTLTQDGVPPSQYTATVAFGPTAAPPGVSGGQGTYSDSDGNTPFFWTESGSRFMLQMVNQDPTYTTLTTYEGEYGDAAAVGWFTNFSVSFCAQGYSMVKQS